MVFGGTATVRMVHRFAMQHLLSASHFSRQVGEIERINADQQFGAFFENILTNATACIFACVASLEAYANEFYIDRDANLPTFRPEVLDSIWAFFEKKQILEKFDFALLLKNQPALDRGSRPTQDVKSLVELRNALTHFKPEWEDEKEAHAKVSRQLKDRFAPSQFVHNDIALFPRKWACHGCTVWAVNSCRDYLAAFESAAGIAHKLDPYADRLKP